MSAEPQLERSVLERKEREELQTIARALGAEPTSRAKKADLVDMILAQAGVTPGAEGGNGSTEAPEKPKRSRSRASASAPSTNGVEPVTEEAPAPAEPEAKGEADADAGPASADEPVKAEPEGNGDGAPGDRDASDNGDTRPRAGDRPNDREPRDRDQQDRDGNRQHGDGQGRPQQDRQGQGQGQGQGGQGEDDGNRRRRRRGRERDRNDQRGDQRPDEQWSGEPVEVAGLLDLRDEGYGFVRTSGYLPSRDDSYVSVKQVRQFGLRKGDHIKGASRPAQRNEKNPALLRIDQVNGKDPEVARQRPRFEDLTPLFPDEKLRLETADPTNMTARIIDLISPIGKGQRGLIVSPPKAGKTTVMKLIAKSIERNNPEVHLMVLLVDERPEEVTDMRRSVDKAEVIASTFDRPSEEHTQVAELAIDRAKRLVEEGQDVVIILDGITRLARAYNLAAPASGRIMSGGIDTGALYPPKKFFGAARNIEEGGSLTILATALIDTGSKMDEVIFEEFKGTGNMELRLDRKLAERRIYPALDVDASSTRHEELLFDRKQLQQVWRVRRALNALSSEGASVSAALERLMDGMKQFKSNDEFLEQAAKSGGPAA